jgi:hypothetical protein
MGKTQRMSRIFEPNLSRHLRATNRRTTPKKSAIRAIGGWWQEYLASRITNLADGGGPMSTKTQNFVWRETVPFE